jgi:hypothetical protein
MTAGFADDQEAELLDRTTKGEPLTRICADPRMPSRSSVYEWIESDEEFAGRFRAARARGVHAMAEECLDIADEPVSKDDSVAVANKRVRIDTRLRLAGKWLAKDYGDKIDVNYNAEVTHRHDLSGYSADELDALEKLIAKSADASGDTGGEGAAKPHQLH